MKPLLLSLLIATAAAAAPPQGPSRSWVETRVNPDSVSSLLAELPRENAEGIWQASADGATVAIIPGHPAGTRGAAASHLIVIIDSPRPAIPPGTVMGWMRATAKPGCYHGAMFTRCEGPSLTTPKDFTFNMADNTHLTFTPVKGGLKIHPWRLLPYAFRFVLREERANLPDDLEGFIRVSPCASPPATPRYL